MSCAAFQGDRTIGRLRCILRSMKLRTLCWLAVMLAGMTLARGGDPFAEYVRSTAPNTPEQEQKTFHLPSGFEITLVAAEPEIGKPMNLAFDSRGRLWVTSTHEYPFPAKSESEKKDTIKVIELGEDGRAAKVSTFAEKLDIPVGVYPIGDGSRVIAYDVNNVC